MKKGYLSQYFESIAIKTLSAVEVDSQRSNQHEFNGAKALKSIFGEPKGKVTYPTLFMYVSDMHETPLTAEGFVTWYDSRQKARLENGVMRWEYRLYFPSNEVMSFANEGDILIVAKKQDQTTVLFILDNQSTSAQQLLWLFGHDDAIENKFSLKKEHSFEQSHLNYVSRDILQMIGIDSTPLKENYLEEMLQRFEGKFPTTKVFSTFARGTINQFSSIDDPDQTLMLWMEQEESLFRTLEQHFINKRLQLGFENDVDGFISYSLSIQNRRKSRAGYAFENHLEHLFQNQKIAYSRNPKTENKSKPDFLFPNIDDYFNDQFPVDRLTMLGVKTSCKDRWRQILTEANRIENKHLITLEASISPCQTAEMQTNKVQLIIPSMIQKTYQSQQQSWLMSVTDFINLLQSKNPKQQYN